MVALTVSSPDIDNNFNVFGDHQIYVPTEAQFKMSQSRGFIQENLLPLCKKIEKLAPTLLSLTFLAAIPSLAPHTFGFVLIGWQTALSITALFVASIAVKLLCQHAVKYWQEKVPYSAFLTNQIAQLSASSDPLTAATAMPFAVALKRHENDQSPFSEDVQRAFDLYLVNKIDEQFGLNDRETAFQFAYKMVGNGQNPQIVRLRNGYQSYLETKIRRLSLDGKIGEARLLVERFTDPQKRESLKASIEFCEFERILPHSSDALKEALMFADTLQFRGIRDTFLINAAVQFLKKRSDASLFTVMQFLACIPSLFNDCYFISDALCDELIGNLLSLCHSVGYEQGGFEAGLEACLLSWNKNRQSSYLKSLQKSSHKDLRFIQDNLTRLEEPLRMEKLLKITFCQEKELAILVRKMGAVDTYDLSFREKLLNLSTLEEVVQIREDAEKYAARLPEQSSQTRSEPQEALREYYRHIIAYCQYLENLGPGLHAFIQQAGTSPSFATRAVAYLKNIPQKA